jgi:hypothetical protein
MMDYLDREKITPPQTTAVEFNEGLDDARKIMKRAQSTKD